MSKIISLVAVGQNIGAETPHLRNSSTSDGQNAIEKDGMLKIGADKNLAAGEAGIMYGSHVSVIRHLSTLKVGLKDNKELSIVFRQDHNNGGRTELAAAFLKEDEHFSEIIGLDNIGFQALTKTPVSAEQLSAALAELTVTLAEHEESRFALLQPGTKQRASMMLLSNMAKEQNSQLPENQKRNMPYISVENIPEAVINFQNIFDQLPSSGKEAYEQKCKQKKLEAIYALLKTGAVGKLSKNDLVTINLDTFYKLASNYRNGGGKDERIEFAADRAMARYFYEQNSDLISSVSFSTNNYTTVCNLKDGTVLSLTTESISPSYDNNGFNIGEIIKNKKKDETNGGMLLKNPEQLKKNILLKTDANGDVIKERDPNRTFMRLIETLALTKFMEEELKKIRPRENLGDDLSYEAYQEARKQSEMAFYSNQKNQAVIEQFANITYANFAEVLKSSDLIDGGVRHKLAMSVAEIKEAYKKNEGGTSQVAASIASMIRLAVKNTISSLKVTQDSLLYVVKKNISATDDATIAPRQNGRGADLADFDYATLLKPGSDNKYQNFNVVLGFGAIPPRAGKATTFRGYLMPLVFFTDDKKTIVKPKVSVSMTTDYVNKAQKLFQSLKGPQDEDASKQLETFKKRAIHLLEEANQVPSQIGNKLFAAKSFYDFKKEVNAVATREDLLSLLESNELLNSVNFIPSVAATVASKKATVENIQNALKKAPLASFSIAENDRYPSGQILASMNIAQMIENAPKSDYYFNAQNLENLKEGQEPVDWEAIYAIQRAQNYKGKGVIYKNGKSAFMKNATKDTEKNLEVISKQFTASLCELPKLPQEVIDEVYAAYPNDGRYARNDTPENKAVSDLLALLETEETTELLEIAHESAIQSEEGREELKNALEQLSEPGYEVMLSDDEILLEKEEVSTENMMQENNHVDVDHDVEVTPSNDFDENPKQNSLFDDDDELFPGGPETLPLHDEFVSADEEAYSRSLFEDDFEGADALFDNIDESHFEEEDIPQNNGIKPR